MDRTLFYALHRANTTKGFIEGAGVVAVARAEAEAMRFGLPCPEPCVDEAVEGLRRDMLSLGLIWDEPQPDRDRKRRILTNWSPSPTTSCPAHLLQTTNSDYPEN
uniref:DotM C-terminal cytoplasmic domain-containing protein n=1 Tax=Escherichia coli TaxID=562 RepID=A0A6D1P744_ECOLX|nr:hypothetical protein PGJFMKIC_00019 [Escherichia coli]